MSQSSWGVKGALPVPSRFIVPIRNNQVGRVDYVLFLGSATECGTHYVPAPGNPKRGRTERHAKHGCSYCKDFLAAKGTMPRLYNRWYVPALMQCDDLQDRFVLSPFAFCIPSNDACCEFGSVGPRRGQLYKVFRSSNGTLDVQVTRVIVKGGAL